MSDEVFVPKSVSVTLGLKVKVGGANSYNMATINYTLTGDVPEGVDPQDSKAAIEAIVDGWVGDKLATVKEKNSQ